MVVENLPLVGYLVNRVMVGATHLSREDLAQAGSLALIQAADSFDSGRGIPFGSFARERIIGGIRDEMRAFDWAKRSTRKQIKDTTEVAEGLAAQLGRRPTVDEVAGALGVTRDKAREGLDLASRTVTTLDATFSEQLAADISLPGTDLLVAERLQYLDAAVTSLPERMRYIIETIYLEGRTVGEVAAELGVTHSAVSQQKTEALRLLREGFDTHYGDGDRPAPPAWESRPASPRRNQYLARFAEKVDGLTPTGVASTA
ncbi:sigma-70 family RNA polymerase sigma factor [Agromyces humi]|uniref:sigma-70 family RNA polymerase sigma factor n=1 Tax=Agromyces humi TaxID=1766800 RepID=UPI001F1F98ED|nr:sigma-70 family RNA polymerase sigma factor [Agromyces humi]